MTKEQVEKNIIFDTVVGSQAYGTSVSDSDTDTAGVCFPNKESIFGIDRFEQFMGYDSDRVIYEIGKAMHLWTSCNPNMIDLLFVSKDKWLKTTRYWDIIHSHRNLFVTKQARFTYVGYAISQLRRIETHKKWLMNPIKEKPKRSDFGLSENHKEIPKDQYNAILSINSKFLATDIDKTVKKEIEYQRKLKEYNSYVSWKENRNPKRAIMENKVGYDVKHAMHLIRLIRMGKEILLTGEVNVNRTGIDSDYLLDIRNGLVPWSTIRKEVGTMEQDFDTIYNVSKLPKSPDRNKINRLLISLYEDFYGTSPKG